MGCIVLHNSFLMQSIRYNIAVA